MAAVATPTVVTVMDLYTRSASVVSTPAAGTTGPKLLDAKEAVIPRNAASPTFAMECGDTGRSL